MSIGASVPDLLHPSAIAPDVETFPFGRTYMAPAIVCCQWATTDGAHAVEPTTRISETVRWIFDREHEQIWFHNGSFDISCMLEWYPEHASLIWSALCEGRVLDTMLLQRLIEIGSGKAPGPLGLDSVAGAYGVPPPDKHQEATHPDYPGEVFDLRTSFGLWYNAPAIPEPWYAYADYDSVATLKLAERMLVRAKTVPVRLEDLATVSRTYLCWRLIGNYGLHVNPASVSALQRAAVASVARLREDALENGFLRPKAAAKAEVEAGLGGDYFCAVRTDPKLLTAAAAGDAKAQTRLAKHDPSKCVGCRRQLLHKITKQPVYARNQTVLKAAVTEAFGGNPPLTEKKKDKKTGKMRGGGQVSISASTLEDSNEPRLESFAEYGEWAALLAKDLKILGNSPVHTNFKIANSTRPITYNPNILNFRRNSFILADCAACGYSEQLDARHYKPGTVMPCPQCGA